jgi:hypothetical protein
VHRVGVDLLYRRVALVVDVLAPDGHPDLSHSALPLVRPSPRRRRRR